MTDAVPIAQIGAAAPQRRHLTILFADLSGSTGLAATMEAEHYASMLERLRRLYQEVIARHGGHVVRLQGDGMLAIFGQPQAREDDGRRACEAALELHATVRALTALPDEPPWGAPLALHSGIHAGLVLVESGDEMRGRFELLGNIPNIAARLSSEAGADEILVSAETLGLQSQFFETGAPRQLRLKGVTAPLAVHALSGRSAITRRYEASQRRGLTAFVGRAHELALLTAQLDDALAGRPRWAQVRAAAGVGKTRLIEQFLDGAAARVPLILRGYCESPPGAEPLQPFLQMLDSCPAAVTEAAAARATAPDARPQALLELLLRHARRGPLLLAVDDLQWADDASVQLLHRLRAQAEAEGLALLLVTALRPPGGDALPVSGAAGLAGVAGGHTLQLQLQPFSEVEARAVILALLPGTDPFVVAEIELHAGGNPLFIEELCHAARPKRQLEAPPAGAWLGALVESRQARLPLALASVLRWAAVIGNVVPIRLLEELGGLATGARGLEMLLALAEQDFLFPAERPGELRFKHGLTREIVYAAIGLHERRHMHGRVAAALRAHSASLGMALPHELLVYHDGAAGDWASAADHAEQAGDQALAASALDRAKQQYRAALAALEHLPVTAALQRRSVLIAQRFGMACVVDATPADLEPLERAAQRAEADGDAALIARAQYWLGHIGCTLGRTRDGLAHCRRGLAAAGRCGDGALVAQLHGTLGQLHAAAADYDAALPLLDDAIAVVHRSPDRAPAGLAWLLTGRARVLGDRGEFAAAHRMLDQALALVAGSDQAVEASVEAWRAVVLLWQGRWAEAQQAAAEAQRIGAQVRSLATFALGQAAWAYGAWTERRAPTALAALQDATAWLAPRGGGPSGSLCHGWLAELLVDDGQQVPARHHVAAALQRARGRDWLGAAMAARAAARLTARDADGAARAARWLALARRAARRRGAVHELAVTELCAAEVARAQGRPHAELLAAAEHALAMLGMGGHLLLARRLR